MKMHSVYVYRPLDNDKRKKPVVNEYVVMAETPEEAVRKVAAARDEWCFFDKGDYHIEWKFEWEPEEVMHRDTFVGERDHYPAGEATPLHAIVEVK